MVDDGAIIALLVMVRAGSLSRVREKIEVLEKDPEAYQGSLLPRYPVTPHLVPTMAPTNPTTSTATGAAAPPSKKKKSKKKSSKPGGGGTSAASRQNRQQAAAAARVTMKQMYEEAEARKNDAAWLGAEKLSTAASQLEGWYGKASGMVRDLMPGEKNAATGLFLAEEVGIVDAALKANGMSREDVTIEAFGCLLEQARR